MKLEIDISLLDNDFKRTIIDDKERNKLIRDTEKIIRRSPEYRRYIKYLLTEVNIKKCSFLKNIDKDDDITIEFHHYPFSLYDLVEIVLIKSIAEKKTVKFNTFELANEVMFIHFQNLVGLVPLTKTLHQLAHQNALRIPFYKVYGKVKEFVEKYGDYFTEELIISYTEASRKDKGIEKLENKEILDTSDRIEIEHKGKLTWKNIKLLVNTEEKN